MEAEKNNVLIIGKVPPPTGGVTIHVSRLLEDLARKNFRAFRFIDLRKQSVLNLLLTIPKHTVIHLHTSNTYLQLITAAFCFLTNRKLIITYHGNWGRFGYWRNMACTLSACLAHIPIAQNQESLVRMRKLNQNALLIPAFIRANSVKPLQDLLLQKLLHLKKRYQYLFCTNATNLAFDKFGREIYGIEDLVRHFSHIKEAVLIVCNPSDSYKKYIEERVYDPPENVIFITENIDFINILWFSDAFIRNTTTDGDSISIHEALSYGLTAFATNCVTRPDGCITYKNIIEMDFVKELKVREANIYKSTAGMPQDTTAKIISMYKNTLVRTCK